MKIPLPTNQIKSCVVCHSVERKKNTFKKLVIICTLHAGRGLHVLRVFTYLKKKNNNNNNI